MPFVHPQVVRRSLTFVAFQRNFSSPTLLKANSFQEVVLANPVILMSFGVISSGDVIDDRKEA